jgi:UDP-N-acetylglucosamine acyltransferase
VVCTFAMSSFHPTVMIDGEVSIGPGSFVDAFCYLRGPIIIGANTRIFPHCVIGTDGEHRDRTSSGIVRIGSGTTIREMTVITRGVGARDTEVGDDCYIMGHCHVCHDSVVEAQVTLSPNVVLAGHTRVHRGATLGVGASTHQHSTIGAYAMVGMGAVVTRDIAPFALVAGVPARFLRFNTRAFAAAGIGESDLAIESGELRSENPIVRSLLEHFRASCRRPPLALTRAL